MTVNKKRLGLSKNMYVGISKTATAFRPKNEDVFCILDADDWLSKDALETVAAVYKKHPETLVTYGSYIKESIGRKTKISRPYPKLATVRRYPWRASHLKTMRWKVLKNISKTWFVYKNEWLPAASDVALMLPILELAGLHRCRHISKAIYHWRDNTEFKTNRKLQKKCEKIIRHDLV